jgi:hypothetical protein
VRVTLQRRPGGGGTWVKVNRKRHCTREIAGVSWLTDFVSRKCNKDYRVVGKGFSYSAKQGVHLKQSDTSKILQSTC